MQGKGEPEHILSGQRLAASQQVELDFALQCGFPSGQREQAQGTDALS